MIWSDTPHLPAHISMVDALGLIPHFLDDADPRPAAEQIAEMYVGGWPKFDGFTLMPDSMALSYPGDPDILPWAETALRDERIVVYPYGWTAIIQQDGTFEVARLD